MPISPILSLSSLVRTKMTMPKYNLAMRITIGKLFVILGQYYRKLLVGRIKRTTVVHDGKT